MIVLPAELKNILEAGAEETFYAARIWHRGSSLNLWTGTTHYTTVELNGVTYDDSTPIIKVDNVQIVSSVDRSLYAITIGDTSPLVGDLSSTGLVGKLLEVRLGFIDPATELPIAFSIVAYRGLIDSISYEIVDASEALKIGAASPMNDLGMKKFIYLTKETIRKRNPRDSSCDMITKGSIQSSQNWGKTIQTKVGF